MKYKITKILLLIILICVVLIFIKTSYDNTNREVTVEKFCNDVKVGLILPDIKNIDKRHIIQEENFFMYNELTFMGSAVCKVELKNGKVIKKEYKNIKI